MLLPYDQDLLMAGCEEMDRWRQKLDYRGPLPRAWAGRLRRELEAEAVAASTAMEGVNVTVDEVRRILAGQPTPEVAPEDRELVEGYRDATNFVLRRADDRAVRWTRELLVSVHDRVLAGKLSQGAGRLRTDTPAFVVNRFTGEQVFLPPPGEEVPALVDEACAQMEEGHPHAAIAAGWIHIAIAAIHPFRDGNGRVARICASLAMYRGGFKKQEFTSLEEWWGRHLTEYYVAFSVLGSKFDGTADVTQFVRAHIDAQLSQVRALDTREQVEREIWTGLEELALDANLNVRVTNALWDAFFGRSVTAGYYRSLADVSPATATNDLSGAVSAGLLEAVGQRRGRRYVATERLGGLLGWTLLIGDVSGPVDSARDRIVSELGRRVTMTGQAFGLP
jgi:Fic family protein